MNDFLKNLKELWTGLPKSRQTILIVAASAILVILSVVIYLASQPKMVVLFDVPNKEEAAKVVEFLKGKKISYELKNDGKTILVPEPKMLDLRLQLASAGIPRTADTAGGVGYELFDKQMFGQSDFMQRANYYRALQGELARTIKQVDSIEDARVMIVVPEPRLFVIDKERREAKASIFVKMKQTGSRLSPDQVKAIRFLVSNGVEGLQPEHVAILDNNGRSLADDDNANGLGAVSSKQLEAQINREEHLREKAQFMLDQALGFGQAVVQVSADLDFDNVLQQSETYDPKVQIPRAESITNETSSSKTEAVSGTAGAKPNTEVRKEDESAPLTTSSTSREVTLNNYELNKTVENRQRSPGDIRRLTIAVMVNVRKTGTGPTESIQVRTPQEIRDLEEIVKQAVGFTQNDKRQDAIHVQEMPFVGLFEKSTDVPITTVLGVDNKWLPYLSQGFLVILAIAVLFYLRSILKSATESETDASGEFGNLLGRYKKMADDALAEANRDKGPPTYLTAEELSKLIRDNPQNTSQAIKVWLSRN